MKLKLEIKKDSHCVGECNFHYQFTPAYRKPIFSIDKVRELTRAYLFAEAEKLNVVVITAEFGPDHLHIFVANCKNYTTSELAQKFKGFISYIMRKNHMKVDIDHHLIRDYDVSTASLHDGEIDLIERGDKAAYRDKGYFGKQLKAKDVEDKTMKRATRARKLNGGEQLRNKAISRIRCQGERPYSVMKRTFHGERTNVKTLERVEMKELFKCFAYNLYQLVTLQRKEIMLQEAALYAENGKKK